MKKFITFLALVCVTNLAVGQAQKTLVKSFNLQGKDMVMLDLKGDVEVQEWNNSTAKVMMTIELANSNSGMLKYMVTKGRYNIKTQPKSEGLLFYTPGLERPIKTRTGVMKENITYVVYLPSGVDAKIMDTAESTTEAKNEGIK